ncbi:PDZ domain-containing protein [Nesterenkonia sp. MY13]|uniref:PDZ domain-containing protein n=1 Tax=Nesterenkonia sedimenti TaxID=1463632 RepID=A0A7X8TL02_9MICC|nr:site-2 protease family protein [Nesterenkonia sedimenti]NLS10608.1 PDZ domain-containing protein [Nesterenkonia sedimenti]
MALIGILIIVVGIILSIALHEIGHLVPAKLFKVRVTQYMVGFGPTLWSKTKGETEYGVKAVPLGGYVAMIGMYPPPEETTKKDDAAEAPDSEDSGPKDPYLQHVGAQYAAPPVERSAAAEHVPDEQKQTVTSHSTGLFQQMSQDAREVAAEELKPGDEDRMFYRLSTWKKIIIMLGGPAMNGILALLLTAGTISTHGMNTTTTQVADTFECITTVEVEDAAEGATQRECGPDDPPGPAHEAGLEPGDEITSFGGQEVEDWEQLTELIRDSAGESSQLQYLREGEEHTTEITPILTERPVEAALGRPERDSDGNLVTEPAGFIGVVSQTEVQQQPPWEAGPMVVEQTQAIGGVILNLPQHVYSVAVSTFTAEERDPDGPMSVVGVGRIAGEISVQEDIAWETRFATLMSMLAAVNLALMVFNLIPLLPLDGGHVAGALYESLRRMLAKLFRRPDPGPFDISKLLPLTYVVAILIFGMGGLFILADIVNPIRLFE